MENNKTKSLCFQVSIFISVWLFLILLITNVLFVFHISIGIYNTIIALIGTVVFCQLLYKDTRSVVKITVVSLIVAVICIAIAGQWIDCSWDGSTYHKFATGALKDGWNPIYESILSFSQNNTYQLVNERVMTWSEAYPKASWYIAANIYCITGNIECGKAYTLLFMAILFGCVYEYAKAKNIVWWKCGLIAFVSILNPVCLAQMVSYYLDGMAACVLIILIISLLSMAKDEIKVNWEYAVLAFTMIAFGCNLKFSITFFVAISCLTYFVYMAVIKKGKQLVTTFVYFAISVIVAFLGVGCTTYLTNLVRYHNMFYGFLGSGSITENVDWSQPFGIAGYNNFEMFFASLFGRMGNASYGTMKQLLKIPFTFRSEELDMYSIADPRTGGFGVLYSGIFVVSIIVLIIYLIRCIKNKKNIVLEVLLIGINILAMAFLPGTFQARYVGHIYIVSILALIILAENKNILFKLSWAVLSILMLINISFYIKPTKNAWDDSRLTYNILKQLKEASSENPVFVNVVVDEFVGSEFNLRDYDINYVYDPDGEHQWQNATRAWIMYSCE